MRGDGKMNVLVYGSTDKRFLIYPMLKIFQKIGDTCLITNDKRYKRCWFMDSKHNQ